MPNIPYLAQNFGRHWGAKLAGSHSLPVTWDELIWSAVTVGKPGLAHLFTHGFYSLSDVIVRTHTVYAHLRETASRYEKSTLYDSLDPTEKGAASYFFGMMAAKLVAARLLRTPWLFHLSAFKAAGGAIKLNGNSQPDLIGLDHNGHWIVVEAKGRTNGFDPVALAKAKTQTRKLRQINGQYPALRVGIQAYFSPSLEIRIDDPEEFDEDAVDVVAEVESLLSDYYSFVHAVTKGSNDVRDVMGRKLQFHRLEGLGLSIGVDRRISAALDNGNPIDIVRVGANNLAVGREGQVTVFPDGIAVQLDERWSKDNMTRQPQERSYGE